MSPSCNGVAAHSIRSYRYKTGLLPLQKPGSSVTKSRFIVTKSQTIVKSGTVLGNPMLYDALRAIANDSEQG
jgi:hypothetical protein